MSDWLADRFSFLMKDLCNINYLSNLYELDQFDFDICPLYGRKLLPRHGFFLLNLLNICHCDIYFEKVSKNSLIVHVSKLCFHSTSTYSTLEVSHFMRYINSRLIYCLLKPVYTSVVHTSHIIWCRG